MRKAVFLATSAIAISSLYAEVFSAPITHPMTVTSRAELAIVKKRIAANTEPQASAYKRLISDAEAAQSFVPDAPSTIDVMGGYQANSNLAEVRAQLWRNAHAAYASALAYTYSGNVKYANKSLQVLNAWAKKGTTFTGQDRGLQIGSYFSPMLYAADLLADFSGWIAADKQLFQNWWRKDCLVHTRSVMITEKNNWKDAGLLGVAAAAVALDDTVLLKVAMDTLNNYFKGDWKIRKDSRGTYLPDEVTRNDGSSGVKYTGYALTTMVQALEIARYAGYDYWHKSTSAGATIKETIEWFFRWNNLNEPFPWNSSPSKCSDRLNPFELANNQFAVMSSMTTWLNGKRPVNGAQGDEYVSLNKGAISMSLLAQTPTPVVTEPATPPPVVSEPTTPPPAATSAVTASAWQDPNVPANALDESLATRWSAEGDGQWIQIDLKDTSWVNAVSIAFYQGNTRTTSFDVLVSNNGTTWSTAANAKSNGTSTNLQKFSIPLSFSRFVRILGHGNSDNLWNSYTELAVHAVQPTTSTMPQSTMTVSASTYQSPNAPANTLDGSLATRWSAEGDGQWIQYDLKDQLWVNAVSIAFYSGNSRTASFDVMLSNDASAWNKIYSGKSSGTTLNAEKYSFPIAQARYVRIVGHGNSVNTWTSLTEVQISRALAKGRLGIETVASQLAKEKTTTYTYDLRGRLVGGSNLVKDNAALRNANGIRINKTVTARGKQVDVRKQGTISVR